MTDKEILEKVLQRVGKNKSLEEVIIAQEKEIDYLRERIKKQIETDEIISFKVNQNTNSEHLHNFLLGYVPMGEVLKLYRFLKKDMEV